MTVQMAKIIRGNSDNLALRELAELWVILLCLEIVPYCTL